MQRIVYSFFKSKIKSKLTVNTVAWQSGERSRAELLGWLVALILLQTPAVHVQELWCYGMKSLHYSTTQTNSSFNSSLALLSLIGDEKQLIN